jgi:predicted transcriptional regulator of viral defense system
MVDDLISIAKKQNGFITSTEATHAGIPRRCLTEAVSKGKLQQIGRGLYALPHIWEDEYVIAQHRFSRGTFSHETALFLHGLTDRTPEVLTMTFPQGYNTSTARKAGLITKTVFSEFLDLGVSHLKTPFGNEVAAYNIERTLCDVVRGKANPDPQLVNPAMKAYTTSKDKDINLLLDYASKLGVASKVRTYMEILL